MLWALVQQFIIKLKNDLVYKSFINNLFLIAFFVLLVLLSINNIYGLIFLIAYGYYLGRIDKVYSKHLLKLSLIISSIIVIHYLYLELSYETDNSEIVNGQVIDINRTSRYNKLTVRVGKFKNIIYDYDFFDITVGDNINATGLVLKSDEARIKGGFNYEESLKIKRVTKTMMSDSITVINSSFRIEKIKHKFLKYLDSNFDGISLIFLKAMIIGDDDGFDESFKNAITSNGILHLFAVSGLHIVLFVDIISKVLKTFKIKQSKIDIATSSFLFIYIILTSFAASVLRASLMYFFGIINKRLRFGFSSIDVLSFTFILLLIINPYYMYDLGFILSFLASIIIVLISPIIKNMKHFRQLFVISCFVMIITLPTVVNINNDINLLSPITNVLFIDLVEGIILPISLIVLVLPFLSGLYEYLLLAFYQFTILISEKIIIKINLPSFSFISIVIYYLLIISIFKFYFNKRLRYIFISVTSLFLIIVSNSNFINSSTQIDFLDLYNGESIVIRSNQNNCNAIIDTGDGKNSEVSKFLKREGIKKLDYLILSHNHADHNGEANLIINEIKVNNLVISAYDNSVFNFNNILRVEKGDVINCGNIDFSIIHPDKSYSDENDNSIVIYSKIGDSKFLFLGDVTKSVEDKIAKLNLDVDVIKIAHHGSKTSTSIDLISQLKPKYAIIQTGRVEKFGFPHKETIATLNEYNVDILRTDKNYSIRYKYNKYKSMFSSIK